MKSFGFIALLTASILLGAVASGFITMVTWGVRIEGKAFHCTDIGFGSYWTDIDLHKSAGDTIASGWSWEKLKVVRLHYIEVFWLLWAVFASILFLTINKLRFMNHSRANLIALLSCIILSGGCQSVDMVSSHDRAQLPPVTPVTSKSQDGAFEVTTTTRTNGCTLELYRFTGRQPNMLGYWAQTAFVGGKQIFRIQHSTSPKEQALMFERMTHIMVMPIDRDLDGRYEMFLLLSPKDQRMIDMLVLTQEGWFRLGTPEEFEARQKMAEENRRALKELNKTVQGDFD